jgi:hypothetical protein
MLDKPRCGGILRIYSDRVAGKRWRPAGRVKARAGGWPIGSKELYVPNTILEAIKLGQWDFEPQDVESQEFDACSSMPGTKAKLTALAERVRRGLPLWHPGDRQDCEDLVN